MMTNNGDGAQRTGHVSKRSLPCEGGSDLPRRPWRRRKTTPALSSKNKGIHSETTHGLAATTPPALAATTPSAPSRRCRWRHWAKPRGRGGGGGPSPAAPGSGSAWILVGLQGTSSRWWGRHRVRIREPELNPYLGKATCGGAGELLAWFPLRSADLGSVGSPGAIVFRRGRGVSGVCSGVGGLLMLLPFPWPAVVASE
jgi:hypothetical protein